MQLTHEVKAPWDKACSATVTTNCIKGWRIYNSTNTGGVATELFLIPVVTPFAGTVTASGQGPYSAPSGIIGATTVGLDAAGKEIESLMVFATGAAPPNAPKITITITISGG
ncbi:MAG TPA: hypothetical protein VNN17_05775 [Terriglobia bacterium]|nr:hypothetical protein [Terriglobia bacterium]